MTQCFYTLAVLKNQKIRANKLCWASIRSVLDSDSLTFLFSYLKLILLAREKDRHCAIEIIKKLPFVCCKQTIYWSTLYLTRWNRTACPPWTSANNCVTRLDFTTLRWGISWKTRASFGSDKNILISFKMFTLGKLLLSLSKPQTWWKNSHLASSRMSSSCERAVHCLLKMYNLTFRTVQLAVYIYWQRCGMTCRWTLVYFAAACTELTENEERSWCASDKQAVISTSMDFVQK